MDENGLDQNIWKKVGTLLSRRSDHRSIIVGNRIIHIGGTRK